MENSYRFYRNISCEYFPCHKVIDKKKFNCLFCYCPLYYLEECGGNYVFNKGIKICTECLVPHSPKGYDYINDKIKMINDIKRSKHLENQDEK